MAAHYLPTKASAKQLAKMLRALAKEVERDGIDTGSLEVDNLEHWTRDDRGRVLVKKVKRVRVRLEIPR